MFHRILINNILRFIYGANQNEFYVLYEYLIISNSWIFRISNNTLLYLILIIMNGFIEYCIRLKCIQFKGKV